MTWGRFLLMSNQPIRIVIDVGTMTSAPKVSRKLPFQLMSRHVALAVGTGVVVMISEAHRMVSDNGS